MLQQALGDRADAATGLSAISPGGATSVRGKLADGRAFNTSSFIAKNGDYPFYLAFNRGQELLLGWLNFPAGQGPVSAGTVLWLHAGTNPLATTLQAQSVRE